MENAASIQEKTAVMPDYDFREAGEDGSGIGTSIAGLTGSVVTFILAGIAVLVISLVKRKQKGRAASAQ